ncbi:hypothetical protein [Kitasatospora griseola]|uniref:hypothetical protein n=1 Tax=Kitasatospora griseola TaxID=2064 RepID=UPI00365EDDE3
MKPARAGTTENLSVSMPADLIAELRTRAGRRGVSNYVTKAVRHRLAMDGLAEIVAAHEADHGALTAQEIEEARRELFGEGTGRDAV